VTVAPHERRYTKTAWLALAVLLLCVSAGVQWWAGADGDKHYLLVVAQRWLAGKRLYSDIFQPSFPLITWIDALAVLAASSGIVSSGHALATLALLIVGCSVYTCHRLMQFHPQLRDNAPALRLHALLLGFVFILWANPSYFADREHLFTALLFPYMLRYMPSLARQAFPLHLRIAVAVMATAGICIKPYCAIPFLGVQLLLWIRERSLRMSCSLEHAIIYGGGIVYLATMWHTMPDYFSAVLPMALATYSATNRGIGGVVVLAAGSATMLAVTLADFRLRHDSPYRRDILYFLCLCPFFMAYILANNGWGYAFYALNSLILYLTGWVYCEHRWLARRALEQGASARPFVFGGRACAMNLAANTGLVLLMYFAAFTAAPQPTPQEELDSDLIRVVRDHHFQSFGMLSAAFNPWPILADATGARQETRFDQLWMIIKFLTSDAAFSKKNAWIPRYVAEKFADDLNRNKPDVIFVEAGPQFYNTDVKIDLVGYFGAFPSFHDAWTHYSFLQAADRCGEVHKAHKGGCRYDVYRRIP